MAETRMEVDSMDTALAVFGSCDENIRLLEQALGVTVVCRGTELKFSGPEEAVQKARRAVDAMLSLREGGTPLEEQTVRYCISLADAGEEEKVQELAGGCIAITEMCIRDRCSAWRESCRPPPCTKRSATGALK